MNKVAPIDQGSVVPLRDDDRAAILRLLDTEIATYLARDFHGFAACWVHDPHVRRWAFLSSRGIYEWVGWDKQAERMRAFMAAHPLPSTAAVERENINLHVGGDIAWMTFDEHAIGMAGPLVDVAEVSAQMRVFERELDGWKIAFACKFHRTVDHVTAAVIRVDGDGAVLGINDAAARALRDRPGIAVRAGCIRATERAADQRLHAAIRWAACLDDGIWPRRGALPVVLSSAGDTTNFCWVVAHDGQILIALDNRHLIEEQLAAAAAVYGITPAQKRLAVLIVEGRSAVDAARQLGVSVNTARTHLKRLYERTGVASQPALVRVLLGVGAPVS